jgi:mannose-1-phosphate guanylyltransferase/mannose-6-phosphate isomerase
VLLEPCARNTAPAVALAAHYIKQNYNNAPMLVLPSDHIIANNEAFRDGIAKAERAAAKGHLVTFGITPTAPETGYGYIQSGKAVVDGESYQIARFVEKPDAKTAESYLAEGNYAWNSGMFFIDSNLYLAELAQHRPDIAKAMDKVAASFDASFDFTRVDSALFATVPSESIDYAVMEHTSKAAVVPMECGWTDVGSWDALWSIKPKDENGNAVLGEANLLDTENCYIACNDGVRVATLGVKDLVVISTKDSILVADKNRSQDVKKLVELIRSDKPELIEFYRQVYRPWGYYDSIDNGVRHQVKRIVVKPGAKLSLQMHHHRAEHWIVVSGTAIVTRDDKVDIVSENQSVYIPLGAKHRLENAGKIPLELIEVQSGSYLGEDDIVRFEDTYGR